MQVKWKYNVKIFFPQPVGGNTVVEWMNEKFCLLENMLKTLAEDLKTHISSKEWESVNSGMDWTGLEWWNGILAIHACLLT